MNDKKSNSFFLQVYEVVVRIPKGYVLTYGQIASYLGHPRSSRMVGWALHSCPKEVPWFRVLFKSGKLPFDGILFDSTSQRELLKKEGISFLENGFVDVCKHLWKIEIPL